jgi:F-type H+-transporting ATPase subunit b
VFFFAEVPTTDLLSLALDPKSNVINWVVLMGLIFWLCSKYLPPVFQSREESIAAELQAAREAKESAQKALADQKEKVARANEESERIITEARQAAQEMRWQIEKQTEKDTAELLNKFEQSLVNERNMAIAEMRAIAIRAAMKMAEQSLKDAMTDNVKAKMLTQFVEQLDNLSQTQLEAPEKQFEHTR